jgi:hypothetical protein
MKRFKILGLLILLTMLILSGCSVIQKTQTITQTDTTTIVEDIDIETLYPYTIEALYSLNLYNQEVPIITCRIESVDMFAIETWQGDDILISVPKNNVLTLFYNGNIYKQYRFYDAEGKGARLEFDCTLLENSFIFNSRGAIYEFDYSGNLIYSLKVDNVTHQVEILDNGNFLIVRSGYDQAMEITRTGDIVWQWNAMEYLQQYTNDNFIGIGEMVQYDPMTNMYWEYRQIVADHYEWTHINSVQKLEDGYLLNLRNLDMCIKINMDNEIVWTFGALFTKHGHHFRLLDNGNLLCYDNGNGRVVEFTQSGEIVWEFTGLYCPVQGWCEKLPNGNYLFPDTCMGRIIEADANGNIVKLIQYNYPSDANIIGKQIYQAKAYNINDLHLLIY